jgi:hypothetical protein
MKSLLRFAPLFLATLLAPCLASAQTTSASSSASFAPRIWSFSTHMGLHSSPPVVGSPVSYERISETSRLLADGTRITDKTQTSYFYRDSSGRTRSERPLFEGFAPTPAPSGINVVEIRDPVAGVQYVLDTQNHIAYRLPLSVLPPHELSRAELATGSAPQVKTAAAAQDDPSRPQRTTESLGTEVMEGVSVDGTRTTSIYPVGSIGNDRPVTETEEVWYSPDLRDDVLRKTISLLDGDYASRLTNITRSEPDPALFQPPADYQIVDGPADGRVTLKFQLPQR